jgi:hypothetical protein
VHGRYCESTKKPGSCSAATNATAAVSQSVQNTALVTARVPMTGHTVCNDRDEAAEGRTTMHQSVFR